LRQARQVSGGEQLIKIFRETILSRMEEVDGLLDTGNIDDFFRRGFRALIAPR
jgi:hypothetical protein